MFHIAGENDIKEGRVTDIYFERTREILKSAGKNPVVRAEVTAGGLPNGYLWGILAGVEESLKLLQGVDSISVSCMPEGSFFRAHEPVMSIKGRYIDFGVYETALLGFLCQASGISTKAARCRIAASGALIYSFGARRIHPAISPMVDRCAYIGGADGVSTVMAAQLIGQEAVGTIPHSLILIMGDTLEATRAFDSVIKPSVKRISLVDTFNDEKFEAINVASGMGKSLFGIRLDTPSSRKGSFKEILEEIRWELDLRGFKKVKLIVSGGLDEKDILELNELVYAFGIGTAISGAEVVDFALDIVEIEGKPITKRGKKSGAKKVLRCEGCGNDIVVPREAKISGQICACCSQPLKDAFVEAIKDGRLKYEFLPAPELRKRVMEQYRYLIV
ncbi:MAG: nicotinate phosphoribosyltransferase [Actinobacteria bacterium]|nr:nicotinate phosphoribosyltransferase [Actinomycetota bacterium]